MDPTFEAVDLTEMMNVGVLLAANERFFWPIGLALTWDYDRETGVATNLHLREWRFQDGHHEPVWSEQDAIIADRHAKFYSWLAERLQTMRP